MPNLGVEGRMDAPERPSLFSTLQGRLLLAALAVLAPVLAGAGIWLLLVSKSTSEYKTQIREAAAESNRSVTLMQALSSAERVGHLYLEQGNPVRLRQFQASAAQINRRLSNPDVYDEPEEVQGLLSVRGPWELAQREIESYTPQPGGATEAHVERFESHMHEASGAVARLLTDSQREVLADLAAGERAARLNWLLGAGALAAALALAGLLAHRLGRGLLEPLRELTRAARALAAGHLTDRVEIESTTELNEVGAAFNVMAEALEEQRAELERHAFADALTGLSNRALFEDRARHALQRVAGRAERVAVLVVDVDGFKLVNEGLGHSCGDALLRQAGERMAGALRPSDTVARLGSDEFAVLIESVRGLDDALGAAERVRQSFEAPFTLKESEVLVTASVGIAMSTGAAEDESELLRRADRAMYRVKQRGRNGAEFFDPSLDDQAADRLETLNALRRAVDRGELLLHYQPIIDLDTGEVRAAEALVRWNRPGQGLVAPLEFIPLAEETGVITTIGAWVLQAACVEARGWNERVPVTVNVSARQLLEPEFEGTVAMALRTSGLEPSRLVLEVTESSVMHNAGVTIPKLDRISATGVRIALDDFGEGYSSLGQLRELPVDILKIARPFIREIGENSQDTALVRGIIELARSLGMGMIAEGIEEPEQQAILRAFDCPLGQGYLFSRPLDSHQLRQVLQEQGETLVKDA
jgi:diguanylate cyclase (GGDEF)-like protein